MATKQIQLTVDTPCQQRWQDMTPTEAGRFCGSCQKTIVDFASMSDTQLMAYFSNQPKNVCGRFTASQLNRNLTVLQNPSGNFVKLRWLSLLTAGLISWSTAQGKSSRLPESIKTAPEIIEQKSVADTVIPLVEISTTPDSVWTIEGRIVDGNGDQPLSGVNVVVKGLNKGVQTDANGLFKLTLSDYSYDKFVLGISSIGFISQEITMTSTDKKQLIVKLAEDTKALNQVVYIGYGTVKKKPTFFQRLRNSLRRR